MAEGRCGWQVCGLVSAWPQLLIGWTIVLPAKNQSLRLSITGPASRSSQWFGNRRGLVWNFHRVAGSIAAQAGYRTAAQLQKPRPRRLVFHYRIFQTGARRAAAIAKEKTAE
jgi:hypothetical protein